MMWSRFVWCFVCKKTHKCSKNVEDENRCVDDCFRVVKDWMIEDWWVANECVVGVLKTGCFWEYEERNRVVFE